VLPQALAAAGVRVELVAVYRASPSAEGVATIARLLVAGAVDAVVFSSGSVAGAVCDALGPDAARVLDGVVVACIGPVTADALTPRGVRVDVVPDRATFPAVISALEARFRAN